MKRFLGFLLLGLLTLLAPAWADDAMDTVQFSYQKVVISKDQPPVFQVFMKVNEGAAVFLFSVESIKGHSAESRAQSIARRFQYAWDVTKDKKKFIDGLAAAYIDTNNDNIPDAWVIEAVKGTGPMPPQLLQVDGIFGKSYADAESDEALVKRILRTMTNMLSGVELLEKDITQVTLEDQNRVSEAKYTRAMRADSDEIKLQLLKDALATNGDNAAVYQALQKFYKKKKDKAQMSAVDARLAIVKNAADPRQKADDAFAAGKYNVALAYLEKAREQNPLSVSTYWLLSLTYEKLKQPDTAVSMLDDGAKALAGKLLLDKVPAFAGLWKDMFDARKTVLKSAGKD